MARVHGKGTRKKKAFILQLQTTAGAAAKKGRAEKRERARQKIRLAVCWQPHTGAHNKSLKSPRLVEEGGRRLLGVADSATQRSNVERPGILLTDLTTPSRHALVERVVVLLGQLLLNFFVLTAANSNPAVDDVEPLSDGGIDVVMLGLAVEGVLVVKALEKVPAGAHVESHNAVETVACDAKFVNACYFVGSRMNAVMLGIVFGHQAETPMRELANNPAIETFAANKARPTRKLQGAVGSDEREAVVVADFTQQPAWHRAGGEDAAHEKAAALNSRQVRRSHGALGVRQEKSVMLDCLELSSQIGEEPLDVHGGGVEQRSGAARRIASASFCDWLERAGGDRSFIVIGWLVPIAARHARGGVSRRRASARGLSVCRMARG